MGYKPTREALFETVASERDVVPENYALYLGSDGVVASSSGVVSRPCS